MGTTPTELINTLLRHDCDLSQDFKDEIFWSFMVHATIVDSLQPLMDKHYMKNKWTIFDNYNLQIGEKSYDMRIITVKDLKCHQWYYLATDIKNSQFSFPWKDNLTLFIELDHFSILEEFIKKYDLATSISKVEEQIGITANDVLIKVITFKSSIDESDILRKYQDHLKTTPKYRTINQYYFMTKVFSWQKEFITKFSNTPIENDFCISFGIFLKHLGTLKNNSDLNIFDLISLRLALCEFCIYPAISNIQIEIDFMVKRELAKIVINNHLNIDQYLISINYKENQLLIDYLIYVFQMYFKTCCTMGIVSSRSAFEDRGAHTSIAPLRKINILDTIEVKTNVNFIVDCQGYEKMSLSLFVQLVNFRNVVELHLDTNYMWFSNHCNLIQSVSTAPSKVKVHLIGNNKYNFVEDFISSFKTVTFPEEKYITLVVYCSLNDYSIFDNIEINAIEFPKIKIDTHMLNGLKRCNLESINNLRINHCTFENSTLNWELLFNLINSRKPSYLSTTIQEDEDTLLILFQYISNELMTSKLKEFSFNGTTLSIVLVEGTEVSLKKIKFSIDDRNSKLEMHIDDQVTDVFDWKFKLKPDDKSDYDFYQ